GWVTWHNSPVSDGSFVFPSTGGPVPSANRNIDNFIAAGIPASKLGIGIDFYGYVWNGGNGTTTGGVTRPRQTWTTDPWVQGNVPYYTIMQDYYQPQYYNWDDAAKASYLSIDNSGSANDKFISYDDEKTVQAKFDYARTKGIGGLIIWELGGGYRANQVAGQQDVLLQAVKKALNGSSTPVADATPPVISITSPSNGSSILGVVTLSANASDNIGVAGVQFKVDGINSGVEITAAPFTTSLNVAILLPGAHTISAVARDAAGNTATASVNVSVIISTTDTTLPVVSITSPANNSTVTGTITVNSSASDNIGVAGVQYKLDGSILGSEVVTSPYNLSWNTVQTTDGTHILSAIARDAAGNTATASLTVNVSNSTTSPSSNLVVYDDVLKTPWTNSSWSATINFSSTEKFYSGNSSIKTTFSSWGALSLQYGGWNSTGINPAQYQQLKFAVYAPASGTKLSVYFQNSQGQSFPSVNYDAIVANQWTIISIPMNQLNPNGQTFDRISIQESGGSNKTLFIDDFSIIGNTVVTIPVSPVLALPANSSTGVSTNPTLSWVAVDGAASYHLQVSISSTFSSTAVDQSGITGISSAVSGLIASTTYYWRVNATNANGTGSWSSVYNFTTGSQATSAGLIVYGDTLKSPWINTSWGTTATFNSTQKVFQGSYSVNVTQSGWAGLRLRNGSWGSPVNISTSNYASFEFAAYGGINGLTLGVYFENDLGQAFPTVSNIQVAANQWQIVSVPISQLNPNNYIIHSITIQNFTGKQKTYFVDNIHFNGASVVAKLVAGTENTTLPDKFNLDQNYPNPFNPSTIIAFNISQQSFVTLKIYNILGQEVATLVSKTLPAGNYREVWDASNFPSGIYIYQLCSDNNVLVKKMNFIK
ncbi:MAG: T9SS type A sorting domain-containing protein, partial [Melioribacter sp.]|nr:T9SS type A sorting domain-containing protein [Melioribacter sp.]